MVNYIRNNRFEKWVSEFQNRHPHYYKMYVTFFEQGVPLKILMGVHDILTKHKENIFILPKNVIHYPTCDELVDDLDHIVEYKSFHNVIHYRYFPKKLWNSLSNDDKKKIYLLHRDNKLPKTFKKYDKLIKFLDENNIKYSYYDNGKLLNHYKKLLTNKKTKLYTKDNLLIARVGFKTFKKVTCKKWCIRHKEDWKEHVKKKSKQYIVIDLDYNSYHYKHKIAFTVNKKGKIKYVFDSDNDEGKKKSIKKYLKLI